MSRLEQLRKLVQVAGDDPMSHYGLGLEYIKLGQWSDAVAAFGRAIEVDPKYSAAYYHKARAQLGAGDAAAARETLARGIEAANAAGDWHTAGEMRELLATAEGA